MDQEPVQEPSEQKDEKPRLFQNANAVIAGITGLVVALGGLAAATKDMWSSKEAEQPVLAAPARSPAAPPQAEPAAAQDDAAPEAGDPTLYKGEELENNKAVTIEWDGKNWILTVGEDSYTYDDLTPEDDVNYEAVSNGNYLRWPIAGGEVDESGNRKKWTTYGSVRPVAESAQ
jgi:hypothetical protein